MATANGCDYCLAAHAGGARAAGVNAEDRANAQREERPIRRSKPFSNSPWQSMPPTGRDRLQHLRQQPEPTV
ncbi:carboxymuconolactone decarboxylase family protein [Rhizobium phaseoli]|uniref:carboxymuconolactone decarboxylase family protein n=1 Tax=Rhizobium phaseoli TaxID=396 RepID=UPI001F24C0F8|nr:carboxymuconolactone decarboxylase family protein [Rhizobium phaseoli]